MRKLYLGLLVSLCGTSLAQSAARDLYSLQAAPAAPVADLIAAAAGHGLTLAECMDRVEVLGTQLQEKGYTQRPDEQFGPGVFVTTWFRPGARTAVMAWMRDDSGTHDLVVAEYAWVSQWALRLSPF